MKSFFNFKKISDERKRFFSLVGALILTLLIIIVWLNWNWTFRRDSDPASAFQNKPMDSIKKSFKDAFSSMNTSTSDGIQKLDNLEKENGGQ